MSKQTAAPTTAQTTENTPEASAQVAAPAPFYRIVADTARKAMQRSQLYRVTSGFYEALAAELGFEKGVVDTMLTRWIDVGSRIALDEPSAVSFALPAAGEPADVLRAKFVAFIDSADFPLFEAMEAAVREYDSAGGSPLSYAAGEQAKTDPN